MGDTAALSLETVSLLEFKWLKPGSTVATVLMLPNTAGLHSVMNLTRKCVTPFLMNCTILFRNPTDKIWKDKQDHFS